MHLLLIESNPASARALHREFLAYRGCNWSLSHCSDYQSAIKLLQEDTFHSVLVTEDCPYEKTLVTIQGLLETTACPPLVAVTGNLSAQQHLNLVIDGSDNCLYRSETTGGGIMRHLRMAEIRQQVSAKRSFEKVREDFPEFSSATWLNASPNASLHEKVNLALDLKRPMRIGHVSCRGDLLAQLDFPMKQDWVHFSNLADLLRQLEKSVQAYDAIVVEPSVFEQTSKSEVKQLNKILSLVPGIMLTMEKSDYSALAYLKAGYSDCLIADEISSQHLLASIRKAVIRRRREILTSLSEDQIGPAVNDRRSEVRNSINRRGHVRFNINHPIVAIPILPSGAPDHAGICEGTATSISLSGVGVTLPHHENLPRRNWVVGFEQTNGIVGYASLYLRRVTYMEGTIDAGLTFQNSTSDFFNTENLWPALNPTNGIVSTQIDPHLLDQWVELNVLKKRLARRTRTCPECESACTSATGCRECGSYDLEFEELIHHFACAHVDKSIVFEHEDSIRCPKCLSERLVAGADFEIFRSHYHCRCCGHEGDATAEVGCCLSCQLRFPLSSAPEIEVCGYDVERLDVLAFVDVARHSTVADSAASNL